jgi:hypothetical protein
MALWAGWGAGQEAESASGLLASLFCADCWTRWAISCWMFDAPLFEAAGLPLVI